jgi:hypothetical protein
MTENNIKLEAGRLYYVKKTKWRYCNKRSLYIFNFKNRKGNSVC